jgi:ribonuclease BN (tRNA processing enzyme)
VAVSHEAGGAPTLVLDAGTGLRRVTSLLAGEPFRGALVLGHLHWDHTQGIPFFVGGDREGARVDMYVPGQGDEQEVFGRFMSPPHFPIGLEGLNGDWTIHGLEPGEVEIEGFAVRALDIPHKGGRMLGFRVAAAGSSFAYLSDHSPLTIGPGPEGLGEYHENALALADGVDLLIHDAQHTAEELPSRAHFGHSAIEYAVGLAERAGAGGVLLYHHDPNRTDDQLDDIASRFAAAPVPVTVGVEGAVIDL